MKEQTINKLNAALEEFESVASRLEADALSLEERLLRISDTRGLLTKIVQSVETAYKKHISAVKRLNRETEMLRAYKDRMLKAISGDAISLIPEAEVTVREGMKEIRKAVLEAAGKNFCRIRLRGIYFLVLKNQIVYIGQSVDIAGRINQHISEGAKEFDSVSYIPIENEALDSVERSLISLFQPAFNRQGIRPAVAPLEQVPLFDDVLVAEGVDEFEQELVAACRSLYEQGQM